MSPDVYCCEKMQEELSRRCDQHPDPFDCPDNLVYCSEETGECGLILHGGGTASRLPIKHCPWCGQRPKVDGQA